MPKALIITNIPNPYRIPLFNELHRQMTGHGWQMEVVFGAIGYERRKWTVDMSDCSFPYYVLRSRSLKLSGGERTTFDYPGLYRRIRASAPDVILVTGYSMATMKLWWRSLFTDTPYMIWSGAIDNPHLPVGALRRLQRKLLIVRARGFVAYGSLAKRYLISLGAPPEDVGIAINSVDTNFFQEEAARERSSGVAGQGVPKLLYVGHLTKGKRLDLMLHALALVHGKGGNYEMLLVGEGPEEVSLRKLVNRLGLDSVVRFEGYRQKREIPAYLAQANCFVFPSQYDVWGLVLVEAMSAGVPCISSRLAGATCDLIEEGENGFAVDFTDVPAVAEKINWILENPDGARKMGVAARRKIRDDVNLTVSAAGMLGALERCVAPAGASERG